MGFVSLDYTSYDAIRFPIYIFMLLAMGMALIKCFCKSVPKEEKVIGILIMLVLMVNSIGSNNGIFTSFNNLFMAAPYTFWNFYSLIWYTKENENGVNPLYIWPAKAVIIAYVVVLYVQAMIFGQTFFFTESAGATNLVAFVENNEVLEGIKMHPDKQVYLQSLNNYVVEKDYVGREVILYGYIPSMSYCLQMPPAFNSWPDLESYKIEQMIEDMNILQKQIEEGEAKAPLVIADATNLSFVDSSKWDLIIAFMQKNEYECTFFNGKYVLYESKKIFN